MRFVFDYKLDVDVTDDVNEFMVWLFNESHAKNFLEQLNGEIMKGLDNLYESHLEVSLGDDRVNASADNYPF